MAASPWKRSSSGGAYRPLPTVVSQAEPVGSDLKLEVERLERKHSRNLILFGTTVVLVVGFAVGFATPTPSDLNPTPGRISNVLGWMYFAAWSLSFYPQMLSNLRRQSVVGMSFDYQLLNVVGFVFYATFNMCLYLVPEIQHQYQRRHNGKRSQVQSADLGFAVHAAVLSFVIIFQIWKYDRGIQRFSLLCKVSCIAMVVSIAILALVVHFGHSSLEWLDVLTAMSYIKLIITFFKYMPQAYMNYSRKSTIGCSIHNFLLDMTGGVLSVAQLLLDSSLTHDWSAVTGDVAKFGLGVFSIVFDTVFILQHYVWFTDRFDPDILRKMQQDQDDDGFGHRNGSQGNATFVVPYDVDQPHGSGSVNATVVRKGKIRPGQTDYTG